MEVVDVEPASPLDDLTRIEMLQTGCDLGGPAHLGKPGFMRDQRVAQLLFAPRLPHAGDLQTYERIVVDLHFTGTHATHGQPDGGRPDEEFYRGAILNYEQARKWRRQRSPSAARVTPPTADQRLRITLQEEGIYRISGADLAAAGIPIEQLDPTRLRLLHDDTDILPQTLPSRPAGLQEQPLLVADGGDGILDPDDVLLFAGKAVSRWDYSRQAYRFRANLYTRDNVYWLYVGGNRTGPRPETRSGALLTNAAVIDAYRDRLHGEQENLIYLRNFGIPSGYRWYWEDFLGGTRDYAIDIPDAIDEPVSIRLAFFGWTRATHRFDVRWNGDFVSSLSYDGNSPAVLEAGSADGAVAGENVLTLVHRTDDHTRFDWFEIEFGRRLQASDDQLFFDAPSFGGTAEFRLTGFHGESPRVFEVSSGFSEIVDIEHNPAAGQVRFQDRAGTIPHRYLVTGKSRWRRPVKLELDGPDLLRSRENGADYLVIAHADFMPAARRLAAWRGTDDRFGEPLVTRAIDVQDIYDEFSGGRLDPMAIRGFLHYAAGNWQIQPLYVTLFGDGTYDYKGNSGATTGNWIPPVQDRDSTFDEWFVRLSDDDDLPDMAIGRLTVNSPAEAEAVADKLIGYDREPEAGPWQSRALVVADDLVNPGARDVSESFFLIDAEMIARLMLSPRLDQVKHYLGRFALEGLTKPRARDEFVRLFNQGAVLLTYVGHGNTDVLAHEQMFVLSRDLAELRNKGRLPFMYTAASQVGVFDDPVHDSIPEALLKKPDGGVIGMISATRVGFHLSNMELARAFHRQLVKEPHRPVGIVLMQAKILVNTDDDQGLRNTQRYSLFGDPATRLAVPRYGVKLLVPDTLRALQEVRVSGQVLGTAGDPASGYRGEALLQAFDSTAGSSVDSIAIIQPGSALFRGRAPIVDGHFEATFRLPRDITYKGTRARISAFVSSAAEPAGSGYVEGIALAGTNAAVEFDATGPEITIGVRGQADFASGDLVPVSPVITAAIADSSGINVTGETGHHVTLSVGDAATAVTHAFVSDLGTYRRGRLSYQIPELEPGDYEISIKAWDNFNNSATAAASIRVGDPAAPAFSDLLFHPNPLHGESGHFTFNLFNPAAVARVKVFSLSGRLIDQFEIVPGAGYNQLLWSPTELANGAYLYSLEVESGDGGHGRRKEETGVLQILR